MSVSEQTPLTSYTGNGVTTSFAFPWYCGQADDLVVMVGGAVMSTGFTASGFGSDSGGSVVFSTAPASGQRVVLFRDTELARDASYQSGGDLLADVVNADFDRLWRVLQELVFGSKPVTTSIRVPSGEVVDSLPEAAGRADRLLGFDSDGDPVMVAPTDGTATALGLALADTTGSTLVGYRGRTLDKRLRDRESIEDVGLRTTNTGAANLAALNAALPSVRELAVPLGEYPISAAPTNPLGVKFTGGGKLLKPVTNGTQQLNVSTDAHRITFGQEYLYTLHNKFRNRQAVKCLFSGDSTTEGSGISDTTALIHTLVRDYVTDRGFYSQCINVGHSSATTAQWISNGWLASDLAQLPDLYVIRWGINDPGWLKSGTAGTTDAWETEKALRRDATDFVTSLRSGLATCRAAKTIVDLSIIVMMPNSTSDSPNGRDEKWYEAIKPGVMQACRDYQCAFVDTYSILADSRVAAGRYMDNPYADGRAIHPLESMNRMIAPYIVDLMVPDGLSLTNVPASVSMPAVTVLPNLFGYGISTWKVNWTINGQAVDGTLINIRSADSYAMQIVYPNGYTTVRPCVRLATSDQTAWLEWISSPIRTLSLSNSWVTDTRALAFEKSDGRVYFAGRIRNGTATAGTVIATLPTGYRPLADACLVCACGAGLTQLATLQVNTAGQLVVLSVPSNASLDLSGASFTTY